MTTAAGRTLPTVGLSIFSACAQTTPDARYIGNVKPQTPSQLCQASKATAQLLSGRILFAPDEGVWILDGTVNPNGTLFAERSRPGANHQLWETTFEARWNPESITGTYKTPRCTFSVSLDRA